MAAAFRPVNTQLPSPDLLKKEDSMVASSTTPRLSTAPQSQLPPEKPTMDDAKTPTRATFGASAMAQQKPLPSSPFPQTVQIPENADKSIPTRENSQRSKRSRDSEEMNVDDSDGETAAGDDGAVSDGEESMNADGTRSNKKKKSQRFYCQDYPPCTLSFTRSEHLARHIRKHTGERPFQCHCARRFSRLDNLRQHAQTVHVNEDIPIDSLAASGARYQRHIRTERVRPGSGRARPSSGGSTGTPGRGHSKSLSTSSVASISSVGSNYSVRDDVRRRPPPLVMADPRSRLSLETYRSAGDGQFPYRPASPSDFSTPTSATFSTGQNSPRWGSGVVSPSTTYSRAHAYPSGSRTPGRRLSVPSAVNPFQSPHGTGGVGRPLFMPGSVNASNSAVLSSPNGSLLASPTTSTASGWSRRESVTSVTDEAWRRRTWHPDTNNLINGGSRLSQVITPSQFSFPPAPLPAVNGDGPQQQQSVRLPGIESFDPLCRRPLSPPRRIPSPMMVDTDPVNPPALLPSAGVGDDRRNVATWDMGLHRGLTRLELNGSSTTPPRDGAGAWANEVHQAVQAHSHTDQARSHQPTVRFEAETHTIQPPRILGSNGNGSVFRGHQHTMSAPSFATPRETKRHGWYNGPGVTVHEDRILEGRPHTDRISHPNLNAFAGFPAREQPPQHHQLQHQPQHQPQSTNSDSMRRLDALVAVATSEGSTATAY